MKSSAPWRFELTEQVETHSAIVRRTPCVSEDLEERGRAIRRPGIRDLAHVHIDRSPMSSSNSRGLQRRESAGTIASLLMHLDGHCVAGFDGTSARYGAAVDVTSDAVGGNVGEGAVGLWHADACFALVDTVDPEVLEGCVRGDASC